MTLTVYCVPHAGGTERAFVRWRRDMPEDLRIVPLRISGKGLRSREPRQPDPAEVAADLAAQIDPDQEYVLFGHSLGGLLAYETTRHLCARDAPAPRCLVVAGTRPPHHIEPHDYATLTELDDDPLLDALAEHNAIPAGLRTSPMRRLFVPVLRADLALVSRYTVDTRLAPLPVELRVWYGDADSGTPREVMAQWDEYSTKTTRLVAFAGGHFFPHDDLDAVARELLAP